MSDVAIKVEHISKYYRLGVINSGTLSYDLQSWLWKKMGKEDPNRKIGTHEDNAEGFWALKDLNFEIKKGERVGIIGKNGAGKSTLLKMISQISAPTEGRILIDGKVASLLEVGTGFNPELTGRENIYLNGAILGMKKREVDRKIDEIIAFSEIEQHIDTPVKRYSSGMYVRLAFAVAAHLDSDILIADEVLAVGDATFQKKALGKMNELSRGQGRTVLFVSHNMNAVKQLCQRGIVLEKGKLMRDDSDINESVSWYLGLNKIDSVGACKDFERNEKYPFQLTRVEMKNENGECVSEFEAFSEIIINIKCISRTALMGLYGWYGIRDENGNNIIVFDSKERNDMLNNMPSGEYEFNIRIPKGVLGAGKKYIFLANFTSVHNSYGFNVFSPGEICSFKVMDSMTMRGNRRGAITSVIPKIEVVY